MYEREDVTDPEVNRELEKVEEEFAVGHTLPILHAEPEYVEDGQIVYADGTDWNPGSGLGVYARENGVWVKL